MSAILQEIEEFNKKVKAMEVEQASNRKTRDLISQQIDKVNEILKKNDSDYQICKDAIEVLRQVSDQSVTQSYTFISQSVNAALSRIFKQERRIELKESMYGNHPQLEIILHVGQGKTRSLKRNSGRGLTQIISFLCILSLIVITKSRKLLVIDEILSGLSAESREFMSYIMWNFTEIGFQFIVNEHGFIPKNSKVYHLNNVNDIGYIDQSYIEPEGVYLNATESITESKPMMVIKATKDKNENDTDLNIENIMDNDTSVFSI